MKKVNIEAENRELVLRNSHGDHVIIPAHKREWVQKKLAHGCHDCIDSLTETLPVMESYASDGTVFPAKDPITLVTPTGQRIDTDTSDAFYRMHYNNKMIGKQNADKSWNLTDEVYNGGKDLEEVKVKAIIPPDSLSHFSTEYKKSGSKENEADYLGERLLGTKRSNFTDAELNTIKNSKYLAEHPEYYDEDVTSQLAKNRNIAFENDYLIVSDKNSRGYHVSKDHKVLKTFPVVTGENAGEESKIKSRDWIEQNPGKTFEDYIDYLGKNKIKYTPSGVYFVGKKVEDPSKLTGGPLARMKIGVREFLNPEENRAREAKRLHSYGNKGLIGLKYLDQDATDPDEGDFKGLGEAIHGTGTKERVEKLTANSTPAERKMSAGCINLDGGAMKYCYDNLQQNSPVFLLREDNKDLSPDVVQYVNEPKEKRAIVNHLYNNYEKLKEDFGNQTDDYIQYATAIAGLESGYGHMSMKGEVKEWAAKQSIIRSLTRQKGDASVGATQIKWSGVSAATREKLKKHGINGPDDLDDTNKATIAAMYVLRDKELVTGSIRGAVKSYVGAKGHKKDFYIDKVLGSKKRGRYETRPKSKG